MKSTEQFVRKIMGRNLWVNCLGIITEKSLGEKTQFMKMETSGFLRKIYEENKKTKLTGNILNTYRSLNVE